jgi:hypothetical protein
LQNWKIIVAGEKFFAPTNGGMARWRWEGKKFFAPTEMRGSSIIDDHAGQTA